MGTKEKPLTLGSLFAGIEGFGLGFRRAGFEAVWQVEREPFCIAVLKKHFPNVERYYEIKDCGNGRKHTLGAVDVVTAGFPCQDLSVAGKRAGLAGARSGLFWEVIRIMGELRPRWLVLENVPGLFSSNEGRDFALVLTELGKLGVFQSIAWTVLDSQYFRVAQRRRRVFIVCGPRIGSAEQVLFESEGCEGDFAESGETWPGIAGSLGGGAYGAGRRTEDDQNYVAHAISASAGHHGHSSPRGDGSDNLIAIQDVRGHRDKKKNGIGIDASGGPLYTLDGTSQHAVAFAENQRGEIRTSNVSPQLSCSGGKPGSGYSAVFGTLNSGGNNGGFRTEPGEHLVSAPAYSNGVRDFAGLPEGMDSPRYRALGNAVTASVAQWIAERIKANIREVTTEHG